MERFRGSIPPPLAAVPEPEILQYKDSEGLDAAILKQREFGGEVWMICRPADPHRIISIVRYFDQKLRQAVYAESFIRRFKAVLAEDVPNALSKAPPGYMVGVTVLSLGQPGQRVCFLFVSNYLHSDGRAVFPKPDELNDPTGDREAVHGHGTCWEKDLANAFARWNISDFATTSILHFLEDDDPAPR